MTANERKENDGLYRRKASPEMGIKEEVSPWPLFSEEGLSKCPSMAKYAKISPFLIGLGFMQRIQKGKETAVTVLMMR